MSTEWQEIKAIFQAALHRDPDERPEFIRSACGDDIELRSEVESLLSYHCETDDFLEQPAVGEVADLVLDEGKYLTEGASLGRYRIISLLGVGGMGEVYLAEDPSLHRRVAIKILDEVAEDSEDRLRRFFQEARAASALNHPNILTIHEVGQDDGVRFIVTEFVEGQTLRERVRQGRVDAREAIEIAVQLASALAAAQEVGIVHRDLKPENIMLRSDGLVKVLDFGLAKLTEGALRRSPVDFRVQTNPGMILGTVSYMSPEQARGLTVDGQTDIWSLGVVIYEMLAGELPFDGETNSDVLAAILKAQPRSLTDLVDDIPPALNTVVKKALRKKSDERYRGADEMLSDLREARSELETDGEHLRRHTARERAKPPSRRLRVFAAASTLVLVSLAIGYRQYSTATMTTPASISSIAVLPLEDLAADSSQDYFADGVTDSLINNLARIRALRVVSRNSALRYRGTTKSLSEIARELDVDAVLTGTVRRSEGRVRITAQLVDAATDTHLWTGDLERDFSDVLRLESEMARALADEIRVQLTVDERTRLSRAARVDPEAHEAYLLGRYHYNKGNEESWRKAIEYFGRAVEIAPDYAAAYAGLAESWLQRGIFDAKFFKEAEEPARAAALKALELDEGLAVAHVALANIKQLYDWDWKGAENELNRALELDPGNLTVRQDYGTFLMILGRHNEAVREGEIAVQMDPMSSVTLTSLGRFLYRARRYDEAVPHLQRAVELEPRSVGANFRLGDVFAQLGRYDDAIAAFEKGREIRPADGLFPAGIARVYALMGRKREASRVLRGVETNAAVIAGVYAALGDRDQAFRILENAVADRSSFVIVLKEDPPLEPLHSDPRWARLLEQINFPPG